MTAHPALSHEQQAVLRDLARCRTAALGGHLDSCTACDWSRPSYNSCRNRHCPTCQSVDQAKWVVARMARMLPTHHFHVVLTLPKQLRPLCQANPVLLYNILFESASEALLALGRDPRFLGVQLGLTAVLHTWTRELTYHPHLHVVATGGGLSLDGTRWVAAPIDFLFPVRVLGALFRGKFMDRLVRAYDNKELRFTGGAAPLADTERFTSLRKKLYQTRWVVYCKAPFGGPPALFSYLGRYTHRVGISNQRLLSSNDNGVRFRTRGDDTLTLTPHEFIRRFLLHVLPDRFVKKRHYGLLAPGNVRRAHAVASFILEQQTAAPDRPLVLPPPPPTTLRDIVFKLTGIDIHRCPRCGQETRRRLLTREELHQPARRPPDTS
jgi:hypothetical protein